MPIAFAGMRIGLLGGSFNPPHEGHLHISLMALTRLGLDRVWWLTSPQNPLKPASAPPVDERIITARKLVDDPRIIITGIETALGTQYTADTLDELTMRYPGVNFVWLMGADNMIQISEWRRWEAVFETTPIAVFDRPGYGLKAMSSRAAIRFAHARIDEADAPGLCASNPPAWVLLHTPLAKHSSTVIRGE